MPLFRLFPLVALMALGCQSDEPGGGSVSNRPAPGAEEQAVIDDSLSGQKIGGLINGKISWFKGGEYQSGRLDRVPELYLFYYTASW